MNKWMKRIAGVAAGALLLGLAADVSAERIGWVNHNSRSGNSYVYVETTDNPKYVEYTNGRYGFTAYVPVLLNRAGMPTNGDGCSFDDGGNAKLTVSGSHNFNDTAYSRYQERLRQHPYAPYHDYGDEWYVISWESDGVIYYEKGFVSDEYVNTLRYAYRKNLRAVYEPFIETLEANFVPGWQTGNKIWG